jgi:hypothetical protein
VHRDEKLDRILREALVVAVASPPLEQ